MELPAEWRFKAPRFGSDEEQLGQVWWLWQQKQKQKRVMGMMTPIITITPFVSLFLLIIVITGIVSVAVEIIKSENK